MFRYGDRVLEMGCQRAVAGDDRPAVRRDLDLVAAEREHRLDGEADAGGQLHALRARPVVGDLRFLVHLGADAVADELANDAVTMGPGDVLDRGRDLAEMGARHGRRDPSHHRQAGRVDERPDRRFRLAYDEGPRAVAVPALANRTRVDRHDLAVPDRALARDAVDDLAVDRDAEAGRERVARVAVALERRHRPGASDVALGEAVEVTRRDARLQLRFDEGKDLGD